MKSFKNTESKIKNSRFSFNKSPDVMLNKPPPLGGGMRRGADTPHMPLYLP